MAITCPIDLDTLKLRAEIQSIYARVAADPSGAFDFHRGPEYAATRLNYDAAELRRGRSYRRADHGSVRLLRGDIEREDRTTVRRYRSESVGRTQLRIGTRA